MSRKIFKKAMLAALIAILFSACCLFGAVEAVTAGAEEVTTEEEGAQTPAELPAETPTEGEEVSDGEEYPEETDEFTEVLIGYLQDKYGSEYREYYDLIMEEWTSAKAYIENVLMNAVEEGTLSEESAGKWQAFIDWLHRYTVVWVPAVVIFVLALCYVLGVKLSKKIKGLFSKIFKGNNQTASALITALDSIEILLGNSDKTREQREKIEEAKKELKKDV